MMARVVASETLDHLPADDPAAMQSRRDLRRVHLAMGTRSILQRVLKDMTASRHEVRPLRVLELGAGDGSLMLGVAQTLALQWPRVRLTLLDRQALVSRETIARYAGVGWTADVKVGDVHEWARSASDPRLSGRSTDRWDLILVNLFLHHFEGAELAALLRAIAGRTNRFFACEPRRAWFPLMASHLVGAIGANAVTREDAVLSVQAGFSGTEITALWSEHGAHWRVHERSDGLFSHCFRAERTGAH